MVKKKLGGAHEDEKHNIPASPALDEEPSDELNSHFSERFRGRQAQAAPEQTSTDSKSGTLNLTLVRNIRKYQEQQKAILHNAELDDWLKMPELPHSSEISMPDGAVVELMYNKIDRKWKNKQKYLKTHYLLLREDASSSLREAIDKFKVDPDMIDDQDVCIYEKVYLKGFTFTHKGIAVRISFSTIRAGRKILWQASKRLVSGSVVALTTESDKFRTICIIAVVAARPLQNLEASPPEIDVFFADCDSIEIDPQVPYIMVEAKQGYFEAYRHTLLALQKLSQESFPLSDHLCSLNNDIQPPDYVSSTPFRNLSAISTGEEARAWSKVNILDTWPTSSESTLDDTQLEAIRHILTKRLAIIQGPPGTGKTYVSQIAVETMIASRTKDDPPIIVACQTNHALDQLLLQISRFDPNYIRLGGRSTNAEVKKRALYEVRQAERFGNIPGSTLKKSLMRLKIDVLRLKKALSYLGDRGSGPISAETLEALGTISMKQKQNLEDGASRWVSSTISSDNAMELWLGRVLSPFRLVYNEDNFGFDEVEGDIEIEQVQEVEAEHGVTDEEDLEMLKGDFVAISDEWTAPKPSENTLDVAKKLLDTTDDLWKVKDHLRGPIYQVLQSKAKMRIRQNFQEAAKQYMKTTADLQIGKWERDAIYLKKANIIGMTTTGLSKYRPLIASLKPKVVLIEEAAEVLEGPVTVACVESIEHLILVGDHEQLRGHCSVRDLEGPPYHLDVSMFERLVRTNIQHKTLLSQRRMNPEFRDLISTIYPKLEDHPSVIDRNSPLWGMALHHRCFFMTHTYLESKDEQMSTLNEHEARLVVKFYRHLVRNGVPPPCITVLTFYNGQRKYILREIRRDPETSWAFPNVKTVDSYQGEENYIVLLSLVRNNEVNKIGFLDIKNRVCVALSRAKYGFYIFGNGEFLARNNDLWSSVEGKLYDSGKSATRLPITCQNHGTTVHIQYPEEFDDNNGGCNQKCAGQLACGHACPQKCHPYVHSKVECIMRCSLVLSCGHRCAELCSEQCNCACPVFELEMGKGPDGSNVSIEMQGPEATAGGFGRQNTTMAPQDEAASRQKWCEFAEGGVKLDDQRRAEQVEIQPGPASSIPERSLLDLSPILESAELVPVLNETQYQLTLGRSRFVQEFRPMRRE